MALRPGDEIGVGPVFLRFDPVGVPLPPVAIAPAAQMQQVAPPTPYVQAPAVANMPLTAGAGFMPPPPPPPPPPASGAGGQIFWRGNPTQRTELFSSLVVGRDPG